MPRGGPCPPRGFSLFSLRDVTPPSFPLVVRGEAPERRHLWRNQMRMTKPVAALLAGPVAALAAMVPATPAHAAVGATICTIFTNLHFDYGIPVNPTVAVSGTYYFWGATAICAGTVTGAASITSTGRYTTGQ